MFEGENSIYHRARCITFRKTHERFGGLSNMAGGYSLVVNGMRVRSSEALYQACRFPDRPDIQQLIINENSPWMAKVQAKQYRDEFTRSDWEQVKKRTMRWCLRVKLAQHWSRFGKLLIETEDKHIVDESRRDTYWGAISENEETLVGDNILGRLLMELRTDLTGQNPQALQCVEPVPIRDFLLNGEPIEALRAWHTSTGPVLDPDLSPPEASLWRLPETSIRLGDSP